MIFIPPIIYLDKIEPRRLKIKRLFFRMQMHITENGTIE